MKSTFYIIVEVKDDYNNYVKLSNGLEVMVNNTIDDVESINRIGKVVSSPKGMTANKGDLLMFHHNICRKSWGLKGKKRKSVFEIKDNHYYLPVTEIFMIKREGQTEWEALDPYVFIKPLEAVKKKLSNGLEIYEDKYKEMKEFKGEAYYVNKELKSQGINKGDIITFQENSQHEYKINGDLFYKMRTSDILAVD